MFQHHSFLHQDTTYTENNDKKDKTNAISGGEGINVKIMILLESRNTTKGPK